jgi:hypothetical protein
MHADKHRYHIFIGVYLYLSAVVYC